MVHGVKSKNAKLEENRYKLDDILSGSKENGGIHTD